MTYSKSKNVRRQVPNLKELAPLLKFKSPTFDRTQARLDKAFTIWDLREIAKARTPKGPFDYTDGAAESEQSLNRARQTFADLEFVPSILHDVHDFDLTQRVFGQEFAMPFGIAAKQS